MGARAVPRAPVIRAREDVAEATPRRAAPRTRPAARSLALTLAALVAPEPGTGQEPAFGPLTHEEGSPIQRVTYTAMTESADVVAKGAVSTDLWFGLSNIFEQDTGQTHVLFMDLERLITTATVRVGVHERLEVGGRLTLETTGAGYLDSAIRWWHERLGFGQANRDRFPEGEYRQRLEDGDGTVLLDVPSRTLGLEDVRLFAKWRAAAAGDGRSVLGLRLTTRIPTHSGRAGSEGADLALAALGRLGVGSWYVHGMLGASTVRASAELGQRVHDAAVLLMLGAERSLGSGVAGVVQLSVASAVLRDFNDRELDRAPSNLVLGLAGRFGTSWRWDVSFQEDLPADTPAVDFTLGLRLSRTW